MGRFLRVSAEEQTDEEQPPLFALSLEVGGLSNKYTCVAFLKRAAHLVADKELSVQLRILTLSEG